MRPLVVSALSLSLLITPLVSGCATYHDDLARAEHAFETNQHEQALAIFRTLETDTGHFDTSEKARYFYLRGMTDYRIGYKADARHWLLLANAVETQTPGTLPDDWKQRMTDAVTALNSQVYDDGIESLGSSRKNVGDGAASSGDPTEICKVDPSACPPHPPLNPTVAPANRNQLDP
ncbi:MAG: hypothetical protein ABI183_04865 [Polyangiaceae bacterium]